MRRSLLAYLIVDFRTGTSLVELWFWTVSRWDRKQRMLMFAIS
jgi:hypothetical protein